MCVCVCVCVCVQLEFDLIRTIVRTCIHTYMICLHRVHFCAIYALHVGVFSDRCSLPN